MMSALTMTSSLTTIYALKMTSALKMSSAMKFGMSAIRLRLCIFMSALSLGGGLLRRLSVIYDTIKQLQVRISFNSDPRSYVYRVNMFANASSPLDPFTIYPAVIMKLPPTGGEVERKCNWKSSCIHKVKSFYVSKTSPRN
ncbi:hypothetical protein BDV95DRAFT_163332 [Massariosphaeria phaeospora]|uniref:Uncharacterized protein n=1 Tax=Massariosphaeria phaeospora TaxID=100035 RepID=A0A7C8M419_9PLEO|nr:hypothetical protein BDV95DRAFT_163332 [Massariosphaeria phaeospora]